MSIRRRALEEVVNAYAGPLRSYLILTKKVSRDRASELIQEFLTVQILQKSLVSKGRPEKGKFRTLLLRALDRFVHNAARDERAKKRWAGPTASLSEAGKVSDNAARPDEAFDADWAREVLRQAVALMREECQRTGRQVIWEVFDARIVEPTLRGADPVPHESLAARWGLASAAEASNILVTGKRMYARTLRTVVGGYLSDPTEIDREIVELRRVLSNARK